jgi:nucleotide-binding universal stress UspA family protein
MSIVCASDLSPASVVGVRAAIALAARLGEKEVTLVHVLDAGLAQRLAADQLSELQEETARSLVEEAQEYSAAFPAVTLRPEVLVGAAAHMINEFARAQSASLLVLASEGHGEAPLYRLGGTSERVAAEARVPVIVVRDAAPFEAWARGERALRILVGIDFHPSGDPAVRLASLLRQAGNCELVFGHIYYWYEARARYGLTEKPGWGTLVDGDARLEALLKRDIEDRVGKLPGEGAVTFAPKLGLGRLGDHLLELAESEKAALVVVGTRRRVGMGRLASVSSVALRFGHASVACAPQDGIRAAPTVLGPVRTVLIATDLSPASEAAIKHGYRLLGERGGEVHLVYVESSGTASPGTSDQVQRLRALVPASAADQGIVTRTHVMRSEDPAHTITEAAQRVSADVICIASRGRGALTRALLGSVTDRVVRESVVPVLLVRSPS